MSTEEPSKCCVCGEGTTKRCQACAKHGIHLFFCSPEHQKLVWKHHKQVCGPNAHPLSPPACSDDELRDLLAHGRHPRALPAGTLGCVPPDLAQLGQQWGLTSASGGLNAYAVMLENYTGSPAGSFETIVVEMLRQPTLIPDVGARASLLSKARAFLLAHLEVCEASGDLDVCRHTVWAQIARFSFSAWTRNLSISRTAAQEHLHSRIEHQLLVLISIVRAHAADGSAVPTTWILRSFEQLADLLTEVKPFRSVEDVQLATKFFTDRIEQLRERIYMISGMPGWRTLLLRYPA
ncbi:Proteophosphoglycan 5 [Rhodotorula toruloides]|nr:Proteophosphoglycan 5 [Rhodotorula toruloides]